MTPGYDLRPLITGMSVPWHVTGGGADQLSPPEWVDEMARLCPAPVSRISYAGARHSMTESPATALGPSWRSLAVDWLHDRILGKPAANENRLVTPSGDVLVLARGA
jgi:hypothetical protein